MTVSDINTPEGRSGFESELRKKVNLIKDLSIKKHYGLIFKQYLDEYGLKLNTDLKDIKYEALKSLNLINLKHDYLFVEKRGFMK